MNPYYQDSAVTIYHGDCREILPTLSADAVITDPPYNCGKDYGTYKDNLTEGDYNIFMKDIINKSLAISTNQFWVVPRYKLHIFLPLFPGYHLIVITRGATGPYRGGWSDQFEVAVAVGKPSKCVPDLWNKIRLKGEGYFFREETFGHPGYTPYPIMLWACQLLCKETVVDPFCGTGTTLRAAKDLNRKAIGIEINEKYCEIAANRMCQEVLDL